MKANKEKVIAGIKNYISSEIAPQMSGVNAFAIYFILPSLDKKLGEYYDALSRDSLFSDLVVDNGVDLDMIRQRAFNALDSMGGKLRLKFLGSEIALEKDDIDAIYRTIKES